jgi:hypothetical protein
MPGIPWSGADPPAAIQEKEGKEEKEEGAAAEWVG